jgi:polysaccharide export outer membrane protein
LQLVIHRIWDSGPGLTQGKKKKLRVALRAAHDGLPFGNLLVPRGLDMSKRSLVIFVALFGLAAVFSVLALAQSPSSRPEPAQSPQAQLPQAGPADLQLDAQGSRRYRVGPGDLLDVRVFGQPDLNSTVEIDEDGNISSLPFIEDPIPAKCRNEKEIQKEITDIYSRYIIKPRISVRVLERRSRPPAVIFGAVRSPTRVQMMRRVRLHELLALSGGITGNASGTIQIMHTEKELCAEPDDVTPKMAMISEQLQNGNEKPTVGQRPLVDKKPSIEEKPATTQKPATDQSQKPVADQSAPSSQKPTSDQKAIADSETEDPSDIGQLAVYQINTIKSGGVGLNVTTGGGLGADPYIRPGDIVIVTEGLPIYITGGVMQPGPITMKDQMTLLRAIAMAGGVQRLAKSSEIHIYRQKEGKLGQDDLKINYDAIKSGKQPDMPLQAYDIIDVRMQNMFSPKSLGDFFMNMGKSSIGILPSRVIY